MTKCFRCHHDIPPAEGNYISGVNAFCHRNWTDCIGHLDDDLTESNARVRSAEEAVYAKLDVAWRENNELLVRAEAAEAILARMKPPSPDTRLRDSVLTDWFVFSLASLAVEADDKGAGDRIDDLLGWIKPLFDREHNEWVGCPLIMRLKDVYDAGAYSDADGFGVAWDGPAATCVRVGYVSAGRVS